MVSAACVDGAMKKCDPNRAAAATKLRTRFVLPAHMMVSLLQDTLAAKRDTAVRGLKTVRPALPAEHRSSPARLVSKQSGCRDRLAPVDENTCRRRRAGFPCGIPAAEI